MLKTLVEREQQFSDYKQTDQKSNMKTKRKVQVSENKNKGSRKTLQRNPWIKNNEDKIHVVVFFFFQTKKPLWKRKVTRTTVAHISNEKENKIKTIYFPGHSIQKIKTSTKTRSLILHAVAFTALGIFT